MPRDPRVWPCRAKEAEDIVINSSCGSSHGRRWRDCTGLLLAAFTLAGLDPSQGTAQDSPRLELYRSMVTTHRFYQLQAGSSQDDSLKTLGRAHIVAVHDSSPTNATCLVLVEVLSVTPPDSSRIPEFAHWSANNQQYFRNRASLLTLRTVENLGLAEGKEGAGESLRQLLSAGTYSIHTLSSSTWAAQDIGSTPLPVVYAGAEAYVRLSCESGFAGSPMADVMLCIGDPGISPSPQAVKEKVSPLCRKLIATLLPLRGEGSK